jgi:hypothetical protein
VPWLGPVWAPALVAVTLVVAGTRLYLTADRAHRYGAVDWLLVVAGGLMVVGAFVSDWRAVIEQRTPASFPTALFLAGWLLGTAWFTRAELLRRGPRADQSF